MAEKNQAAKAIIAANISALRAFQSMTKLAFEGAGPTLASKIAMQQVDLLITEYEEIAEVVSTMELPAATENAFDADAMKELLAPLFEKRANAFGELARDARERITTAAREIARDVGEPDSDGPMNAETLAQGTKTCFASAVAEQAEIFTQIIEGSAALLACRIFERLQEKLESTPAPETANPAASE